MDAVNLQGVWPAFPATDAPEPPPDSGGSSGTGGAGGGWIIPRGTGWRPIRAGDEDEELIALLG